MAARTKLKSEKLAWVAKAAANVVDDTRDNRECSKLPDFDRIIHERIRLGIVSALAINKSLSFTDLKRLLNTTDGNLSVHTRKLEEAEYISCHKYFEGRIPRTDYSLTAAGRRGLDRYIAQMEGLIHLTRTTS